MKRPEYLSFRKPVEIVTDGGTFLVNALRKDCINVATPDAGVEVRGVPIRAQDNYVLQEDGSWLAYHKFKSSHYGLGARRTDREYGKSDVTPAMNKTIVERMQVAADAFVRDYPIELAKAEVISVNNDIYRLDKEVADAENALNAALTKRRLAESREIEAITVVEEMGEDMSDAPRI